MSRSQNKTDRDIEDLHNIYLPHKSRKRVLAGILTRLAPDRSAILLVLIVFVVSLTAVMYSTRTTNASSGLPTPPFYVCGNPTYLASPYNFMGSAGSYTSGQPGLPTYGAAGTDFPNDSSAIVISPGAISLGNYQAAATLYYFEPGSYTVSGLASPSGNYTSYVGGYANGVYAVLDGGGTDQYGWGASSAANITIEYLTVQNFVPPDQQAVVDNGNAGNIGWQLQHNTFRNNGYILNSGDGSAAEMGPNDVYEYNCFTDNGQYAVNAATSGGGQDAFVNPNISSNEISYNGFSQYPDNRGCGCSGGVKFWQSWNAIFTNNYIHNNYLVGVWFDTNNTGALVQGNYFADNYAYGISYEIGYNANIDSNVFIDNGVGNTSAAIYINESGGDSGQSGSNYLGHFYVTNNTLINNWSGIIVSEDSGRYCSAASGQLNAGGDGVCTLQPNYWSQNYPSASASTTATGPLGSGSLPLSSTSNFTSPGWIQDNTSLGPNFYYYTGISGNNLTGLSLVNGAGAPANGDGVSQVSGCRAALGLGSSVTIPGTSETYWQACVWQAKNITVSGNTISFNQTAVQSMSNTSCIVSNTCGLNGQWAFVAGGGWGMTLSGSQSAVDVSTFTGSQTLALVSTTNIWQSIGEVSVQTSSGYAYLDYSGVSGNTLDNVSLVSGSGTLVVPGGGGITNLGCTGGGAAFTCNNLSAYNIQNDNTWSNNTYYGPQSFMSFPWSNAQGTATNWATWSGSPVGSCTYPNGCNGGYGEDSGGTFSGSGGSYWSVAPGDPPGVMTNKPVVNIYSLYPSEEVHGPTLSIKALAVALVTGNTIANTQLQINGSNLSSLGGPPYDYTVNTVPYLDGSYSFAISTTDSGNNTNTITVPVYISNGDFNGDGHVNLSDLAILAAHWGQADSNYSDGNITGQSTINLSDLAVLAANWGWTL